MSFKIDFSFGSELIESIIHFINLNLKISIEKEMKELRKNLFWLDGIKEYIHLFKCYVKMVLMNGVEYLYDYCYAVVSELWTMSKKLYN